MSNGNRSTWEIDGKGRLIVKDLHSIKFRQRVVPDKRRKLKLKAEAQDKE